MGRLRERCATVLIGKNDPTGNVAKIAVGGLMVGRVAKTARELQLGCQLIGRLGVARLGAHGRVIHEAEVHVAAAGRTLRDISREQAGSLPEVEAAELPLQRPTPPGCQPDLTVERVRTL